MRNWLLLAFLTLLYGPLSAQELLIDTIRFDFDSYLLKDEYLPMLDSIIARTKRYPAYYIEVHGHTDSIGSQEYNQSLSEQRARVVVLYLRENGLDLDRMEYVGFGVTKPVASNESFEGRTQNRRAELAALLSKQAFDPPKPAAPPVADVPPVPVIDPASITDTIYCDYDPFTFNARHKTVVITPSKARIVVPPGAFAGDQDTLRMEVRELFARRDMILSEMPTISRNGPLEVPGILTFDVTSKGRLVKVNKGAQFELLVPATRRDDDMGAYFGTGASRGGVRKNKLDKNLPVVSPIKTWNEVNNAKVEYLGGRDKGYLLKVEEPGAYAVGRELYRATKADSKDPGTDITVRFQGKRFEKNTSVMIVGEIVKTYIPLNKKDIRTYSATKVKYLAPDTKLVLVAIQYDDQGNPWIIKRSFAPGDLMKKKRDTRPAITIKAKFRKSDPETVLRLLGELNV
ncbi:MAG: OmpA family protein [Bacteroidia bacterium]|nr:OmpA family protein [Bacteroidia bacterium]